MSKSRKIPLTKKQQYALFDIRGTPDAVHSMIYSMDTVNGKEVLKGSSDDFDELLSLISEEIGEGLCPKKNITPLLQICEKVDPESLDWIGM